jgi:hypothetical protein
MGTGGSLLRGKSAERQAPPSGAEVTNEWNYISNPLHAFMAYMGTNLVKCSSSKTNYRDILLLISNKHNSCFSFQKQKQMKNMSSNKITSEKNVYCGMTLSGNYRLHLKSKSYDDLSLSSDLLICNSIIKMSAFDVLFTRVLR